MGPMTEVYRLFYVKQKKGMWGFWMGEASYRKVRRGNGCKKGLAYIAYECQV